MQRSYNRQTDELRPVSFIRNFTKFAKGSILATCGETKAIVTASVDEKVPKFLSETGMGWLTAEYSMLPASTHTRTQRERNYPSGRTVEIQRLIGRCLRAAVDRQDLGERTITVDCDVIQADGGTRTTCINGGFLALYDALSSLKRDKLLPEIPITEHIAAISVGISGDKILLDLDYEEDSKIDLDANLVMTESMKVIEFQCTAEGKPISVNTMNEIIQVGFKGISEIIKIQKEIINS